MILTTKQRPSDSSQVPVNSQSSPLRRYIPDSKVHRATKGPIWGRQDPGGPHVGQMNLDIWASAFISGSEASFIFVMSLCFLMHLLDYSNQCYDYTKIVHSGESFEHDHIFTNCLQTTIGSRYRVYENQMWNIFLTSSIFILPFTQLVRL